MANKYPLTESQFESLNGLEDWNPTDIPFSEWRKIPNLPRREDTIAVMASGCISPGKLNGVSGIVGIDVLVHEPRPKPGEKSGNAYHFVIQKINDDRYPYLMHGPFCAETLVDHHFDVEQLSRYWPQDETGFYKVTVNLDDQRLDQKNAPNG